jgi:ABC-2 type transport system permease protein
VRAISIIFKRELGAYLTSPVGWVVAAIALFLQGILFQAFAMGGPKKLSAEVLSQFFYFSSAPTMIAAVALSMRLISEERQQGTMVLLNTSPVRDSEIVIGKFLSAFVFLCGITLASIYMPLLVHVRGKISFGHVAVGYTGLILLGAAVLAIGVFASSLARQQLVAGVVGAAIVGWMLLLWQLAKIVDPPVKDTLAALDLFARHFPPFQQGILHLRDVVYYLAVTYFFLLLAVKTMEAKRWE